MQRKPNLLRLASSLVRRVPAKSRVSLIVNKTKLTNGAVSYVLEAAVKDLQLLAGEAGLGLELLQALGAVANGRQLQLIFNAVWKTETSRCEQKPRKRGSATAASH